MMKLECRGSGLCDSSSGVRGTGRKLTGELLDIVGELADGFSRRDLWVKELANLCEGQE